MFLKMPLRWVAGTSLGDGNYETYICYSHYPMPGPITVTESGSHADKANP